MRDPAADGTPPPLDDYLHSWLDLQRTRLQPATLESYAGIVRRYLVPHLGETPLDALTVAQLDQLYAELLLRGGHNGKPLGLNTVASAHKVLRKALEDARRVGLVDRNVADDATLPHLDDVTLDAFRRQAVRQEELRAADGDGWANGWDLVFTDEHGGYIRPMDLTIEFRALVLAAPVPAIRLHDIRHVHATLLLQTGEVPIKVVSERLGHANIQMTLDTYAHVLPAMDRQAATHFAAHVWGREPGDR